MGRRRGRQESVRDLSGPGQHGKFLTPGQLDRWVFEGEKGETIIAHVVSTEFDPVLELARTGAKDDDKVLLEVDDPGNESRFSIRLPEQGQYKIRVHAFKYQGGGNYTLHVRRFQAQPLAVGKPAIGTFDREGKSYHYFAAVKDQILIPELKGASSKAWKMLDFKGREMTDWSGTVSVEDNGECCLVVSGRPDYRYDLLVREAQRHDLAVDKNLAGKLAQGEADVWSFSGKPGDFRLLEAETRGKWFRGWCTRRWTSRPKSGLRDRETGQRSSFCRSPAAEADCASRRSWAAKAGTSFMFWRKRRRRTS